MIIFKTNRFFSVEKIHFFPQRITFIFETTPFHLNSKKQTDRQLDRRERSNRQTKEIEVRQTDKGDRDQTDRQRREREIRQAREGKIRQKDKRERSDIQKERSYREIKEIS